MKYKVSVSADILSQCVLSTSDVLGTVLLAEIQL